MNVFPQYIAVQSRVSRFSLSLYSAQTLDQAICWRSKMCFQKFIIYILRYTHRKAPSWVFIRTWVLANHNSERNFCTSEKKMIRPIKFHAGGVWVWRPNLRLFMALVGWARYANCLSEIQRESSNCETKGEWIFALKNLNQNLENLRAMVSYISNSMRKTVESRQNMQQQKWKTKGDVKLKVYSMSELYLFLSMFRINYNFFTIMDRPGNNP